MKELQLDVSGVDLVAWIGKSGAEDMVAIKPLCDALGIDAWRQQKKIMGDPKFNYQHMSVVAEDGKQREMLCIPVRKVSGWLYSINSNKVKPEVAEKLLVFQEHLQIVMHAYVSGQLSQEMDAALREEIRVLKIALARSEAEVRFLQEKHGKDISVLQRQMGDLCEVIAGDRDYLATAASYQMHAAKKRKHLRVVGSEANSA